jgi:hypothetical protein
MRSFQAGGLSYHRFFSGKRISGFRANASFYTFVLAAPLAWADLNLRTVKFRETRMKFFRVQNIPAAPSAQDNHFRFAFALFPGSPNFPFDWQ